MAKEQIIVLDQVVLMEELVDMEALSQRTRRCRKLAKQISHSPITLDKKQDMRAPVVQVEMIKKQLEDREVE